MNKKSCVLANGATACSVMNGSIYAMVTDKEIHLIVVPSTQPDGCANLEPREAVTDASTSEN